MIKVYKVIPDKIGFGLLHKVKVSFPRKFLWKTQNSFSAFFPDKKVIKSDKYFIYTSHPTGCNSSISLAWLDKDFRWPYLIFDGSCTNSLAMVEILLSECLGSGYNNLAIIS